MKTQMNYSRWILIAFTFFILASCNESSQPAPSTAAKPEPPSMDLHTAIITNNIAALKQHIAAGSDLNIKDPLGGSSPLISASLFGRTEMARLLIDAGAGLNFQNNDGSTALHSAAFFCRPEILKMLLDRHADKTIRNKYGATAYASVTGPFSEVRSSYESLAEMLEPMGMKLDFAYLEKTRPQMAEMLK